MSGDNYVPVTAAGYGRIKEIRHNVESPTPAGHDAGTSRKENDPVNAKIGSDTFEGRGAATAPLNPK